MMTDNGSRLPHTSGSRPERVSMALRRSVVVTAGLAAPLLKALSNA